MVLLACRSAASLPARAIATVVLPAPSGCGMLAGRAMGGMLRERSSGAVLSPVVAEAWVSGEERRLAAADWLLAPSGWLSSGWLMSCSLACLACQRAACSISCSWSSRSAKRGLQLVVTGQRMRDEQPQSTAKRCMCMVAKSARDPPTCPPACRVLVPASLHQRCQPGRALGQRRRARALHGWVWGCKLVQCSQQHCMKRVSAACQHSCVCRMGASAMHTQACIW